MTDPNLIAAANIKRWREHPAQMVQDLFHIRPDPQQEEALEKFPHSRRLCMKACTGSGKAQPKDTIIPTPRGPMAFGRLKPGDEVFAGDGSIARVKAVYDRGILPVFKVAFDDGSETRACGDHLWKVRGRTEKRHFKMRQSAGWDSKRDARAKAQGWPITSPDGWAILTTSEIIARGVTNRNGRWKGRQFEIPLQGAVQIPREEHQPIDPYVLGVWIGDGVRLSGKYATKPTPEIETEIKRRGYETSGEHDGIVNIYGMLEQLRGLGIVHQYSNERSIPRCYLMASVDQRTDLICGLMDTDGGIDSSGSMEFSTTSEILAEQVVYLVRSLGGNALQKSTVKKPFYYGKNREKIMGHDCYRVTVRLPFNPFRVPHRKSRWADPSRSQSVMRYMNRHIDRIEPDGEANCMCIEVDHPDHLYLTNDFIVTHNTATLAWIGWNFMLTRPDPMIGATSINGDNLKAGLWTEMARWRVKAPILEQMFEQTKTSIYARDKPETWKMEARTWAKDADPNQIGNALRGVHAAHVMWLLDESGAYPESIMPICEAIFSGDPIEAHIVQAGNPVMLSGPLYRACTSARKVWEVITMTADPDNPKRTPRVSVQHAREQIELWGRDNPFVIVNIFGEFPPSSLNALIGPEEVEASMKRFYRPDVYGAASKVMGVDVAREGDDASAIFCRQGLQSFPMIKKRGLTSIQGAGIVARKWDDWGADACFVDATGGFGAGWIDQLIVLGKAPIGVQYAGQAHDSARYYNKRTEMYFDAVQWIKRGGALPPSPEITAALTNTLYSFKGDRLLLEPKELIKQKIGYSPDEVDAFVQTFSEPVVPSARGVKPRMTANYDPFREVNGPSLASAVDSSYDPFR